MELAGATAVVTGGGSGIGRASALAFADAGASVFVADIAEDAGRETAELIEKESGRAAFSRVDVTDPDQLSRMLVSRATARELFDYCASLSIWSFGMLLVTGLDLILVGMFEMICGRGI